MSRPRQTGPRIRGQARKQLAASLRQSYEDGASIRDLVISTGRSYALVYILLHEAGTTMRPPGTNQMRRSRRWAG